MGIDGKATKLRKGMKVLLKEEGDDTEFTGIISKLDERVIYLNQCLEKNSGKLINGIQEFFLEELESVEILEKPSTDDELLSEEVEEKLSVSSSDIPRKSNSILKKQRKYGKPDHLKNFHFVDIEELVSQEQISSSKLMKLEMCSGSPYLIPPPIQISIHFEGENFKERKSTEFTVIREYLWDDVETPPDLFFIPEKCYLIEDFNQVFKDALEKLGKCSKIGLSFEGQLLGRRGVLSLVAMATPTSVYIFDILKLGFEAFDKGLTDILTNRRILKVLHDARFISDFLKHVLNIQVQNIWDTLAAHTTFTVLAVFQGLIPKYSFSLPHLARVYLGISSKSLFFQHYRREHLKQDTGIWLKRPLTPPLLLGTVRRVMYLLDLQKETRRAMMAPFLRVSDALCSSIRDAEDEEALVKCHEVHILPNEVQDALIPDCKKGKYIRPSLGKVEGCKIHNCFGQIDPKLFFSRDTVHQENNAL